MLHFFNYFYKSARKNNAALRILFIYKLKARPGSSEFLLPGRVIYIFFHFHTYFSLKFLIFIYNNFIIREHFIINMHIWHMLKLLVQGGTYEAGFFFS